MPVQRGNVLVWGADIVEQATIDQAQLCAELPIVFKHVALMPDAHVGKGATVGSVIATEDALIPSAVGVDIGCGMAAIKTNLKASDLPDSLDPLLDSIAAAVPSGVGKSFEYGNSQKGGDWFAQNPNESLDDGLRRTAITQFGTLGSGNHFIELCLGYSTLPGEEWPEEDVYIVLHSGSRGVGNKLANIHIKSAQKLMQTFKVRLPDRDLAYLPVQTDEFKNYWRDLNWSQKYALGNREAMLDAVFKCLKKAVPITKEVDRINCHHNYSQMENHFGQNVWVTRKGAIKAAPGDRGIIPGSMGARTYIIEGLGSPASFNSCSHGAGRRLSRSAAKRELSPESLTTAMEGRAWLHSDAQALVDEHPLAYKNIDEVMKAQKDLVKPIAVLRQILNYKGVK